MRPKMIKYIHAKLEYVKTILTKVSFDSHLFKRELSKALAILSPSDVRNLQDWSYSNYGQQYGKILDDCFLPYC